MMDETTAKEAKELVDELKLQSAAVEGHSVSEESEETKETSNDPRVYTDPNDGTQYEWDDQKRAWFPKIDEDFIAVYQMNYGFGNEEGQPPTGNEEENKTQTTAQPTSAELTEQNTKPAEEPVLNTGQKRKKEPPSWFEMDESKNTNVYVSGLHEETTEEEFVEFMSKCGIIMEDNDTRKPKIKLYRDQEGKLKGDARCCYLKIESVDLALKLLDDSNFKGKQIKVEKAHFEMKGAYNASLKPKKRKKKKKAKGQDKLLDWVDREEKVSKLDRIVVIKNMFDPNDFEKDPSVLLDLKNDIRKECEKYGVVRKVMVFDRHVDGVVSVGFAEIEPADVCIREMNGRWFAGRKLLAQKWDGVTKYEVEETEEEKEKRLKKWEEYLERKDEENA
ncbi:HIV Tat-specific factor 1 homolog [Dendronephthya gigantea]|uniref:HIV Tat-specific factor 1 homolog n=1 Tax=Dendronephthya gigantea TaxID=151771 RepID=UPI00106B0484|nr:HIV Tat-specific factor 1 homolog [Dendronephthya gigantea]